MTDILHFLDDNIFLFIIWLVIVIFVLLFVGIGTDPNNSRDG